VNVRSLLPALVVLSLLGGAAPAFAEDPGAIQERRFRPQHEVSVAVGYLPLDPLTKGVTGSVGYTLHFDDQFAWRVAEIGLSSGVKSSIRQDLQDNYAAPDQEFEEPVLLATSELIWQGLYGRESLFNRGVLWTGTTAHLGSGFVMLRSGDDSKLRPGAVVGLGMKIYAGQDWGMRLEIRDMLVIKELALPDQIVWLSLAATWAAGTR
jgi:outer membrane beta-barrel protein